MAKEEASEIIARTNIYTFEDNLDNVFLRTSKGTIWHLQSLPNTLSTKDALTFVFKSGPPPSGAISDVLINAFEKDDLRRTHWIDSVSNSLGKWYYPNKYKIHTSITTQQHPILFRLDEQYLIRAEAYTMLGDFDNAKKDVDKIRNRAGLGNTLAFDEPSLIQAILQERRVEFFTELGHRFFDLKRTGQANAALTGVKPGWDANDILWPLPQNELLLNPALKPQNAGYN